MKKWLGDNKIKLVKKEVRNRKKLKKKLNDIFSSLNDKGHSDLAKELFQSFETKLFKR